MGISNSDSQTQDVLKDLMGGLDLPGLNTDSVLDNYVEVEFKDSLDECKTPEEREKRKQRFERHYKEDSGSKKFIDDSLSQMKDLYTKASESLAQLKESAVASTASNTIPSVLTVGSATSSPNPAYVVIENKQKKNSLLAIIKTANDYLVRFLQLALVIHFVVPAPVLNTIQLLATITSTIEAIPV